MPDTYSLILELDVEDEPEIIKAEKKVAAFDEALTHVVDFLREFGEPDSGKQTIRITLVSDFESSR